MAHPGGWYFPQHGILSAAGERVPDGALGRLVCEQVIPERGSASVTQQPGGMT